MLMILKTDVAVINGGVTGVAVVYRRVQSPIPTYPTSRGFDTN